MKCPVCQHDDSQVVDSRPKNDRRIRKHLCKNCGAQFPTTEVLGNVRGNLPLLLLQVEKKNGKLVDFDSNKLRQSISIAVRKSRRDNVPIEQIVDNIEQEVSSSLNETVKTTAIGKQVMDALYQHDRWAYIRYLSVHQPMNSAQEIQTMIDELKQLLSLPDSNNKDE